MIRIVMKTADEKLTLMDLPIEVLLLQTLQRNGQAPHLPVVVSLVEDGILFSKFEIGETEDEPFR